MGKGEKGRKDSEGGYGGNSRKRKFNQIGALAADSIGQGGQCRLPVPLFYLKIDFIPFHIEHL